MKGHIYAQTCTRCKYNELYIDLPVTYVGNPKEEPLVVNHCYCWFCKGISKMIEPFTLKHLELTILESSALRNKSENPSVLRRILKDPNLKSAEAKVEKEADRLKYFENNKYPPRCVSCTSKHVKMINLPGRIIHNERVLINIRHRCGGELITEYDGHITYTNQKSLYYNNLGIIGSTNSNRIMKSIARRAKIESVETEGYISGFNIFINQDEITFLQHFKIGLTTFVSEIDNRILDRNFDGYSMTYTEPVRYEGKPEDDLESIRVIYLNGEYFSKWEPNANIV